MKESEIISAYCKIRTIDNTIPDDVLDFMKEAAIEKIKAINKLAMQWESEEELDGEEEPCSVCGDIAGMVNPCCPNYDPLNYKVCGYG